jgi:hypothetical protein
MAYKAIASQTLTSAAASVTFSGIPATYRDLILVADRVRASTTGRTFFMRLNASSSGYNYIYTSSNGSTGSTQVFTNDDKMRIFPFSHTATVGQEPNYMIQVFDYAQTNKHKPVLVSADSWDLASNRYAGRWADTGAVTSITLAMDSGDISTGTFSLYGIEA